MKKAALILLGAALSMITIHPLLAQENPPGNRPRMMANRRNMMGIPDLTEDQQAQIEAIRLKLEKTVIPLKGEIKVLDAELKNLLASGSASERELDRKIDEISALRVSVQKRQVKQHLEIRSLLTEEQKVFFDRRMLEGPRRRMQGGTMRGGRLRGGRLQDRRPRSTGRPMMRRSGASEETDVEPSGQSI